MMKSDNSCSEEKKIGVGPYKVVTISDETYAGLMLKVQDYWLALNQEVEVVDSQITSDRYSQRAYYLAVLKERTPRSELTLRGIQSDEKRSVATGQK